MDNEIELKREIRASRIKRDVWRTVGGLSLALVVAISVADLATDGDVSGWTVGMDGMAFVGELMLWPIERQATARYEAANKALAALDNRDEL